DRSRRDAREASLFTSSLRSHAEDAPPPIPDMAMTAYDRGVRIRRRRRVAVSVTCLAVLAVGLPVGWSTFGPALRDDLPIAGGRIEQTTTPATPGTTGRPRTSPTPPPVFRQIRLEVDQLPRGRGDLAYWSAATQAIHSGEEEQTFEFPVRPLRIGTVDTTRGRGHAVVTENEPRRMVLLDSENRRTLGEGVGTELAVSGDGQRFAWTTTGSAPNDPAQENQEGQDPGSTDGSGGEREGRPAVGARLTVTEAATGEGRELKLPRAADVVGFVGDQLVLGVERRTPFVLDPASGETTALDYAAVFATSARTGLLGVGTRLEKEPTGNGRWCSAVVEHPSGRTLWRSCELTPVTFSPDGRYLVTQPSDTEGAGPRFYTVVDARTGRKVLELSADWLGTITWSGSGDQVLVEAVSSRRFAVARCELDGKCTTVLPPRPSEEVGVVDAPYVLARR
ncbi:MAG TPA: hypothetical protein VI076_02715, partial [Actinopolymorphaceae bacterium]